MKKVEKMRVKIIDGKRYDCPKYLVRVINGWQVRLPGKKTLLFSDGVCGSTKKSFNQAKKYLEAQDPPIVERKDKKMPTGVPGIVLNISPRKDRNIEDYRLQFRAHGSLKTVYVGTSNTWEDRYDDKLAVAARRKSELEGAEVKV